MSTCVTASSASASNAGSAGVSVPIVQKGYAFVPELLYQVAKSTFLGARLRAVRVETALDGSPPAIVEPLTRPVDPRHQHRRRPA